MQVGFRRKYCTNDHIFTLTSTIKEVKENEYKFYCCLLVALRVMTIYEKIIRKVQMRASAKTWEVLSIIGSKWYYPLSPNLFGFYIDELEEIILSSLDTSNGCLLFGISIIFLTFVYDIILMSHSKSGL